MTKKELTAEDKLDILIDLFRERDEKDTKFLEKQDKIEKRVRNLEEADKLRDKKDEYDCREQDDVIKRIECLEEDMQKKATKEDVNTINSNIWKMIIAFITGSLMVIIFLAGVILQGGAS